MAGQYDLDAHFSGALHYRVEVLHLEPEQHAIAVGFIGGIADAAVMMLTSKLCNCRMSCPSLTSCSYCLPPWLPRQPSRR